MEEENIGAGAEFFVSEKKTKKKEDAEKRLVANAGGDFDDDDGDKKNPKSKKANESKVLEVKFTGRTKGMIHVISLIVTAMKQSNFGSDSTKTFKNATKKLGEYLSLNDVQSILFASMFTMYFDNTARPISYFNISDFYQCSPLKVLQYIDEFAGIVEKGYLEEADSDDSFSKPLYRVPDFVADAILHEKAIPPVEKQITRTVQTFLRQIEKAGDQRVENGSRIESLYAIIESKEKLHKNVETLQNVKKAIPRIEDRALFYDIAAGMVNHINSEVDLMILINRSTDESSSRQMVLQTFMDETHILFEQGFVQFENKASIMDSTISFTDKAFALLLGDEGKFYQKKLSDKELKNPEKIQEKELFFMEENEAEIEKLKNALEYDNFRKLQNRLLEKKMPRGICALFYGEPGTGKTETVYQMAKKTNRQIMHVDIGSMRSQWYGETEQKFSKLFSDYRKLCEFADKNETPAPILLFNEADAIFGKRVEINSQGGGGRVDNTIQNILLEEMEKLSGILIATTNLEGNLDGAFERRFLFKVKFQKPDTAVKAKIWKSNLPHLSDEEARILARDFAFSGGEISNIVRKVSLDEILNGELPPFSQIVSYCKSEKIKSGKTSVGFKS